MCSAMQVMHLGLIHLSFMFFISYLCVHSSCQLKQRLLLPIAYIIFIKVKRNEGVFGLNDFLKESHLFWVMNLWEDMSCIMLICLTAS